MGWLGGRMRCQSVAQSVTVTQTHSSYNADGQDDGRVIPNLIPV